jgi:hypothetical protein
VAGRDITEGLPVNVGNPGIAGFWINNAEDFDVAIGGEPFLLAPTDINPYQRETAPYRKDQFDNSKEPGEQSLTGWWIRSQSSFHGGTGIKFYDPTSGESTGYRFADSQGVDVWTKGQVSLLNDVFENHITTATINANNKPQQHLRSIRYSNTDAVLLHDGYDVDKLYEPIIASISNKARTTTVATLTTSAIHSFVVGMDVVISGVGSPFDGTFTITTVPTTTSFTYTTATSGTIASTAVSPVGSASSSITHFIDYNSGSAEPVYAICDDGTYVYWVTNHIGGGVNKLHMFKKPLTGNSSTGATLPSLTGDITLMFDSNGTVIVDAVMEYVKDRIVLAVNNKVYELAPNATTLGTPVYTNPVSTYVYTSIAASGAAIYTAGYNGILSTIQKYTLVTATGAMPVLSSAIVAAEFPPGEIVQKIYYYLGYLMIGTNKGVRVGVVNDQDGSINYGPLIVETSQPVFDFAARDRFVWCASGIGTLDAGIIRIDLSSTVEGESLRFAYANDLQYVQETTHLTTGVAFYGTSNNIGFCTAYNGTNGHVYRELPTVKKSSGYLTTGAIRYGTLEPKNYKFIRARGSFTYGAMDIATVDANNSPYAIITYNDAIGTPEAATNSPAGPQEYISYKFTLSRSASNTSLGPTFKGFQAKSLPATKRQRLIQFPVWCYDVETDRYNVLAGYEGRAWERIQKLEDIEAAGDIINVQDFTTGERVQALVEKVSFVRKTPPSSRYDGFGGLLIVTVRTVL